MAYLGLRVTLDDLMVEWDAACEGSYWGYTVIPHELFYWSIGHISSVSYSNQRLCMRIGDESRCSLNNHNIFFSYPGMRQFVRWYSQRGSYAAR